MLLLFQNENCRVEGENLCWSERHPRRLLGHTVTQPYTRTSHRVSIVQYCMYEGTDWMPHSAGMDMPIVFVLRRAWTGP
jgi:hypothetical protein